MSRYLPKLPLLQMVKNKQVVFDCYRDGNLWYRTEDGWLFPISVEEAKGGTFLPKHKAIFLMRWMRRHIEKLKETEESKQ